MKSKTAKRIAIAGSIVILLTFLNFTTGIFTPYNYLTAQIDILNKNYRLIRYGEREITDSIAVKVSPQFGFKYELTNCNATYPIINGVKAYNDLMTRQLDRTYGSDWFFDWEDLTDSLFRESRIDTIRQIISSQSSYKELVKTFENLYQGKRKLSIWILIHKDGGDNVRVCEKFGDTAIRVFDYYHIDPYSLKLSIVRY
jgi:hypothetical protein